jgi:hypothetical protein
LKNSLQLYRLLSRKLFFSHVQNLSLSFLKSVVHMLYIEYLPNFGHILYIRVRLLYIVNIYCIVF